MDSLISKKCDVVCSKDTPTLDTKAIHSYLLKLNNWELNADQNEIKREFKFKNYGQATAFTNAVAWLAFKEGHHPDMELSYNRCVVRFTTHEINALSENDFICAAKVERIYDI